MEASHRNPRDTHDPKREPRVRLFTDHADAKRVERAEIRRMTPEERLRIGAALHAFWVRHYHRHAPRLDRTLQVIQRPRR